MADTLFKSFLALMGIIPVNYTYYEEQEIRRTTKEHKPFHISEESKEKLISYARQMKSTDRMNCRICKNKQAYNDYMYYTSTCYGRSCYKINPERVIAAMSDEEIVDVFEYNLNVNVLIGTDIVKTRYCCIACPSTTCKIRKEDGKEPIDKKDTECNYLKKHTIKNKRK